ncbi:hypothetical protein LCE31_25685, partial [Streptomyces sp. 8L]|nr:hypothetical protein [Streptomyces sp. 8L]
GRRPPAEDPSTPPRDPPAPEPARPRTTEPEGVPRRPAGPATTQDAEQPPGAREVAAQPSAATRTSVATLGAGIMLLGLGFAFLALRLRRR